MARLKTITLGDALAQCDRFTLDDYDADVFRYATLVQSPLTLAVVIERADEELIEFVLDGPPSALSNGRAYFDDLEGNEHEFVFIVHHMLGE